MNSAIACTPRHVVPAWLIVLGLGCGAVGLFWSRGDHVTAGSLTLAMVFSVIGYRLGILRFGGFLAGCALAARCAPVAGEHLQPYLREYLELDSPLVGWLAVGAAGVGILTTTSIVVRVLGCWALWDRPWLAACNQCLGLVAGLAQGTALALLVLGGSLTLEPLARNALETGGTSRDGAFRRSLSKRMLELAQQTRDSAIGPYVARFNPFERLASLRRLQNMLRAAGDPRRQGDLADNTVLDAWPAVLQPAGTGGRP
jgi:hypothetical protein